jgi:hypothetical protein
LSISLLCFLHGGWQAVGPPALLLTTQGCIAALLLAWSLNTFLFSVKQAIVLFCFLCADWQAVGPPHKQRYLSLKGQPQQQPGDAAAAAGGLLAAAKSALFESGAFARLLKAMIDVEILKHAGEVRRFRAGACSVSPYLGPFAVSPFQMVLPRPTI